MNAFSNRFKVLVLALDLEYFCEYAIPSTESILKIKVSPVSHQKQEVLQNSNF